MEIEITALWIKRNMATVGSLTLCCELDELFLLVTFTAAQWIDFSIEAGQMSENTSEFSILLKGWFQERIKNGSLQMLCKSLNSLFTPWRRVNGG